MPYVGWYCVVGAVFTAEMGGNSLVKRPETQPHLGMRSSTAWDVTTSREAEGRTSGQGGARRACTG